MRKQVILWAKMMDIPCVDEIAEQKQINNKIIIMASKEQSNYNVFNKDMADV